MSIHVRVPEGQGLIEVVRPGDGGLSLLSCGVVRLAAGAVFEGSTRGSETVLVISRGRCAVSAGGKTLGELVRKDVFDELPFSVFLPPRTPYRLSASQHTELVMVGALSDAAGEPVVIAPTDCGVRRVGGDNSTREIRDIVPPAFPAARILVGETVSAPGHWSSYPPHKHDRHTPPAEVALEELYYFKISPPRGFGVIRVYDDASDEAYVLRSDEVVTIPRGYHPVGVIPGHRIYYLWAMAGSARMMAPSTHPDFAADGA